MDKFIFKINRNLLSISILKKDTPKDDLNNTNIIDIKEIIFSKDYIIENLDLVSSFLNVIIIKKNIKKVSIKDYNIILLVLKLIYNMPNIEELHLKPDKSINYKIFLSLLENKTIKKLDVYDIPKYLLERLDTNKDLEINIRSEIFFISNFMSNNNLTTYSNIYYKKNIIIKDIFKNEDYQDFETFININNHLKTINIIYFNYIDLVFIIKILLENNKHNIKIVIEEKDNDLKLIYHSINKIKIEYERNLKDINISFKINYSSEFKKNNIVKQININILKICLTSIILLIMVLMGINYYKNHSQERDIQNIEKELKQIIHKIDVEYNIDNQDPEFEFIEPDDITPVTTPKNTYVSSYYKNYNKVFETLLKINSDTKGWLTVNNTRIDYPIVQASDNEYYLKNDYNQYKNSMGWVFMDFRNNIDVLNQNTIIYGHNINGGIMFGTLRYVLNSSWYTNKDNQIITFNTLKKEMKWQIISIYKIPNTTDYIQTTFYNKEKYQEFLNLIIGRSIYNFQEEISVNDKILTLSTCHNKGNERIVLHAKLIIE
ncbi:MAG: class B sortase [Bacilli bacterium]|nr:class B sortase [Bacilli bacterium]MDD4407218.1 class B sortase [Bacilli bacterium]